MNPIIKGCGFHHAAIWTSDWDASLAFYQNGLGFSTKIAWGEAPSRAVMLDIGDGNYLEVFERDAAQQTVGEASFLHLCLRCDDVDAATQSARNAGAKVRNEPFSPDAFKKIGVEAKISFILGPNGEIIEFFQCAQL